MEAKSSIAMVRMSARKMRLVANEVRGYELPEAIDFLQNMTKKAARIIGKAVKSAGANAKVLNPELDEKKLFIKKIFVDEGPSLKRLNPRARGRADRILKRTSKLTVVVSDE
jgi:large subunit ribosomal protein L22